tara:strand:+ start:69 stop:734 length:666 start_codon:yes stop_codon:yes gene_type:complete
MNIEIRTEILEQSLDIENNLSYVLKEIIQIPKKNTKTLDNRSSSLSFKTKVDLLYDLDRIEIEEYNYLILFMEIRNQFIHNIEADSYVKVFEILGNNKKNKIYKLISEDELKYLEGEKEIELKKGTSNLYINILRILIKVREEIIEDYKKKVKNDTNEKIRDLTMQMVKIMDETIDEFGDIYEAELLEKGIKTEFKKLQSSFINKKSIEKFKEKYPEYNID